MKITLFLAISFHWGLVGCSSSLPTQEQNKSSKELLQAANAIWAKGGNTDELLLIKKTIEGRLSCSRDDDYALARARLHSVPVNIKHASDYYDFVVQVCSAAE